ncbi:lanthionine synthetase LanC family protein [Kitasatospora sp. LaBMicrA B282]|uniref:lanthionine synthetase LanC family protein n=1 Tax=Kitasatospora sp. LaBMicrA B282 TaxID=3420949 RepID=UPI003D0BEF69
MPSPSPAPCRPPAPQAPEQRTASPELSLLALARTASITVPGQEDAIAAAAHWLLNWSTPGPSWPPYVFGDDLRTNPARLPPAVGRRDAWCYGTPGIAAALHHAGQAINYPSLAEHARHALDNLAQRPPGSWDTTGPGLCHGTAGILQTATRLGHQTLAEEAAQRTLFLHGIADEPALSRAGFLTGRAGTALALADHGHLLGPTQPSNWDSPLLLS